MWSWLWRVQWEVKVLTDPVLKDDVWSYQCKLIAKKYYLFGIKVWRKETNKP